MTYSNSTNPSPERADYALVLHGGAGYMSPDMAPEKRKAYADALREALRQGEAVLKSGGTALEAVETSIVYLEDTPLFNAGKGAVFTHAGRNELDASVMDGATLNAGAVGGVTTVKNPIRAALAVMSQSEHVMLSGRGAEEFAQVQGLEAVENSYFYNEDRYQSLQRLLQQEGKTGTRLDFSPDNKFGTVGAVALDKNGNLAAGTSTGGMTNKRYGRIGDSPIIGAGTYADNRTCAVSCTGHGEFLIRYAVAHDISARMRHANATLAEAAEGIILKELTDVDGRGGVIAVDKLGNISMPYNTGGMFRAYAKPGEQAVMIFEGEE